MSIRPATRRKIDAALERVRQEIAGNAGHGKYGAGLSTEGYAGGYRDALQDLKMVLDGVAPQDRRGYWRDSEN